MAVVKKWLEREVARGLQGLIALRLPGAPADDSVTMTLDIWCAALDSQTVAWSEELDAQRIKSAFLTLYRICDRWPAPKHLLDNLGNRDPPPALAAPQISKAQQQKNLAKLREITAQLGKSKLMIK